MGSASNTFNEFRLSASAPNVNDVGAVSRRYFTFQFRAPSLFRFYIFISIFVFFQTAKWLTHSIGELELKVNKVDSTMRRYHSYPSSPSTLFVYRYYYNTHVYYCTYVGVLQVSSGAEKVRRSRGGNISDGGFVRTSQHSASHALPLRLESIGMF